MIISLTEFWDFSRFMMCEIFELLAWWLQFNLVEFLLIL